MAIQLSRLLGTVILTAASGMFAIAAQGQELENFGEVEILTLPDAFDRALGEESEDFYRNRSIRRQLDLIFGFGSLGTASFPDNEIARDGNRLHNLYRYTMEIQTSSDPTIRTPDLVNPFNSSLRTLTSPSLNTSPLLPGSEFLFEAPPSR